MAPPRIEIIGGIYHINNCAVDGTKLFRDESDRLLFLAMFREQAVKSEWNVIEYSLMTTHFHAIIRLTDLTLSSGFQRFNSIYARAYNRRHARRGALWQRRFHDSIVQRESHLFESIRYVALNAPRAGMVERAEDWAWCSYGAAIGVAPRDEIVNEDELLGLFATRWDVARRRLRAYVEEVDPRERLRQTLL